MHIHLLEAKLVTGNVDGAFFNVFFFYLVFLVTNLQSTGIQYEIKKQKPFSLWLCSI